MTPERWARLKDLFEAALERDPSNRVDFISRACSGDPSLRAELEQLISHHEAEMALPAAQPFQEYAFAVHQVVAGRYDVLRPIGRGGMGEVYEAIDNELRERIALKTVRPDADAGIAAASRLIHELQLARRITHPNICRVFDIGRHPTLVGDAVFFTMELLDGETLADRLRRQGPFTPHDALPIARQIADGLTAAHALGIVHRDLKPANVMLTKAGRVAITDFGLARYSANTSGNTVTLTGKVMGTPRYMAPELLAGATPTTASDLYSFGIVLQDMVTAPVPANSLGSTVAAQGTPVRWQAAIQRCLSHEPSQRFPDAHAVISALAGPFYASGLVRRRAVVAAGGISILALSSAFFRLFIRAPKVVAGSTVMVADVTNATRDKELDAVTSQLASQLGQSPHINLWDRTRLPSVLRAMEKPPGQALSGDVAREVALREGVPFVIFGTLSEVGGRFALNVMLEELEPSSIFRRRSCNQTAYADSKSGLFDATHEISSWIRKVIGESAPSIVAHDRLPQDTTTPSWRALSLYARAESLQAARMSEQAIVTLQEALGVDPHFALAKMRLGDITMSLHRQDEALRYWQSARDEAQQRGRLTEREELRISGLFNSEVWDFPAAESAFIRLESEYPNDYLASFYLGNALRWEGRLAESITKFREADRKQPGSAIVAANLTSAYLLARRRNDLIAGIERLTKLGSPATAAHYDGLARFVQSDYEGSLSAFARESQSSQPATKARGIGHQAAVLCEIGKYFQAEVLLNTSIREDIEAGRPEIRADKQLALAYIFFRLGKFGEMRDLLDQVLANDKSPWRALRAAVMLAWTGRPAEARKIAEVLFSRLPASRLSTIVRLRIQGELLLSANQTADAITTFKKLSEIEPALRHREYLGRAYVRSGNIQESLPPLKYIADTPELMWQNVDYDFPGFLTDTVLSAARACFAYGDRGEAKRLIAVYLLRRRAAEGIQSEVEEATKFFARI